MGEEDNKMKKVLLVLVAAIFVLLGSQLLYAVPVEINFDDQPIDGTTGVVITNQYTGVLFSSTPGFVNYVTTQPAYNSTPPNFLCTGPAGGSINCTAETILTFATPISNLTFDGMGINDTGLVAKIDIYTGGIFNATQDVIGHAAALNPELQDLTAYNDITEIRIYDITDGGGIGWDTFKYDQGQGPSAVPEPTTMLLLGSGLLGLWGFRRKLKK